MWAVRRENAEGGRVSTVEAFIKGYSSGLTRFRAGERFEAIEEKPGGEVSAEIRGTLAAVEALKGWVTNAELEMRRHGIDSACVVSLLAAARDV